jgi:glutamyl/glutaminyl-tRNA synthetase
MYVTRIAPSPTGHFHIGTARTALFNYLAAKQSGGKFILRIDDTDKARSDDRFTREIFTSLEWLGLTPDQVYYQSERTALYLKCVECLEESGFVFRDTDNTIKLNMYDKLVDSWEDSIAGTVSITDKDYELGRNITLVRADGSPLYNYCSVVDDLLMGINHVIRGVDHVSNTAKQVMIMEVLKRGCGLPDWRNLKFTHVGLITIGTKKMSKREPEHAEFAALSNYIDKGYSREAVINFLLRMGWGPKPEDKTTVLITMERALEMFLTSGSLKNSPARLDIPKLDSYNKKFKELAVGVA